ncbi:MAG: hypothetical protein ACI4J6_10970 [Oscillospiraceae bacterium]
MKTKGITAALGAALILSSCAGGEENVESVTVALTTEIPFEQVTETTSAKAFLGDYTEQDTAYMPEPFSTAYESDGVDTSAFFDSYKFELTFIPIELIRETDSGEFDEWCASFEGNGGTGLTDSANLYSFIKRFNISRSSVEEYISSANENYEKLGYDKAYAPDFADKLYFGSEADIVSYCASEYCIAVGADVYTPKWLYYHTASDYREAGITADMVESKKAVLTDIPFTDEAFDAFFSKLDSYSG